MDRLQLWRKVWLRLHRRHHSRRRYALAARTNSTPAPHSRDAPPPDRYLFGRRHFSFVTTAHSIIHQRPKALLNVDCSNLLMGGCEQYENFSSTCWLEDHLHRFGGPLPSEHESDSRTRSCDVHTDSDIDTDHSSGDHAENYDAYSFEAADGDGPSTSQGYSHRSFQRSGFENSVINLHRYPYLEYDSPSNFLVEPPPYPNEPPPSYEEAIAGSSLQMDSVLHPLLNLSDNNPDFLW